MVVTYQGVVRYLTHCPEHADTNTSKLMRYFWQTTHYTRPINKLTCTLILEFLSNKILRALWPIRMEYFAIDLSRFVPFLVVPANYRLAGMNSSFDLLEVFANQCSMYVPNGMVAYLLDEWSHLNLRIPTDRWWYRRTNGHIDDWVTGSHKPLRILHSCIPI